MIDLICQIVIFTFGSITIFLLAQKNKWQRWGHITGLVQEPFWFISAIRAEQWGVLVLCFIYTFCFLLGVYNYFIKKSKTPGIDCNKPIGWTKHTYIEHKRENEKNNN